MTLTAEDLHMAAYRVARMTSDDEAGLEDDALEGFINGTVFHPEAMNTEQAIAYGILVGAVAMREELEP